MTLIEKNHKNKITSKTIGAKYEFRGRGGLFTPLSPYVAT